MIRSIWIIIGAIWVYLLYGLYYSYFDLTIIPQGILRPHPRGYFDYRGVIDVHSDLSSGSGSILEIISAADLSGLDFMFINDLGVESETPHPMSGYHDRVLVFVDREYSFLSTRLLNLGAQEARDFTGPGHAQIFLSELLQQDRVDIFKVGLFVWAHPSRNEKPWTDRIPPNLNGLEVVNLKALWENRWLDSRGTFLWSMFLLPFNEGLALSRLLKEPARELELWDSLLMERNLFGFGGTDATAQILINENWSLPYPSYEALFGLVSNHVLLRSELTGDSHRDREKIIGALSQGQFYFSLDMLGNPKGFIAVLEIPGEPESQELPMGSVVPFTPGMTLNVHLGVAPTVPFEIEIFRDGQKVHTANSDATSFAIKDPGVYRAQVRVRATFPFPEGSKWLPWIYTNPWRVTPAR